MTVFSGIFILPYLKVYGKTQEKHLSGTIYYHYLSQSNSEQNYLWMLHSFSLAFWFHDVSLLFSCFFCERWLTMLQADFIDMLWELKGYICLQTSIFMVLSHRANDSDEWLVAVTFKLCIYKYSECVGYLIWYTPSPCTQIH